MQPSHVDDIVASVEDAVRRAYALGRADAMKRVVELAQSDDPALRAVALLGPPAHPAPAPALLDAPQPTSTQPAPIQPHPEHHALHAHEHAADHEDAKHEARQADAAASPPPTASTPAKPPTRDPQPRSPRKPASAGGFLADFFYPIGSKKR